LFALLRQKRKDMADEAGVPPYVIFSDKTLVEMAAYYPQSVSSLLTISGVGQVKLRQYGEPFLEIIQAYCEKHNIKETPRSSSKKRGESPSPAPGRGRPEGSGEGEIPARTHLIAEQFNSGETIQGLMERYQVTRGTILEHLTKFVMAGNPLRNGEDVRSLTSATTEQQGAVFAAFDELGITYLKPTFDKLNGVLNYDELKILRLIYLIARQG
jgi:ATP-dependent DNA helicase RecQ